MNKLHLFESLDLSTLCVSLTGDKVQLQGAAVLCLQQGCGSFLHEWGSLACGGSLHSCVTLFRQFKQDDFANVPMSKGHLSSL